MLTDALLSSPFYLICGVIAYLSAKFLKDKYPNIEIFDNNLPVLPVIFGCISGILFNFLLPDISPFTVSAILLGLKEGALAGLAASKIYEQAKRNTEKKEAKTDEPEPKD